MTLLELFIGFLKVGMFSFGGGYASIPLIRDVIQSYGWLNDDMLSYMIAVSESTPGPIMVNMATYVGVSQAGIAGAIVATLAVVLPSFIVILLVTAIMSKFVENRYVDAALKGIKLCVAGIILTTGIVMTVENVFNRTRAVDITAAVILVLLAVIYFGSRKIKKKGISPIILILISAVCGIVGYGIFPI